MKPNNLNQRKENLKNLIHLQLDFRFFEEFTEETKETFKPNVLDMSFETAEVLAVQISFIIENETGVNVKDDSSPEKLINKIT